METLEALNAALNAYRAPRLTARERRAEAAREASRRAAHAAFVADWIAQGKPLDANGEPDLFAEFA